MAATYRSAMLRDARKDRREEKWSAFFADDEVRMEETWDASIEAILGRRKVTEEDDD